MKERPILFSGPMVRAILAGQKTQTRRIVTLPPWLAKRHPSLGAAWPDPGLGDGGYLKVPHCDEGSCGDDISAWPVERVRCPHGAIGDRLWVRETFAPAYFDDGRAGYRADWTAKAAEVCPEPKWKPSIFMPRALSRLTLEITGVRVERLQEITEADARAEGVQPTDAAIVFEGAIIRPDMANTPAGAFACLWDRINGERASWASNPWVWVIGFKRIDGGGRAE